MKIDILKKKCQDSSNSQVKTQSKTILERPNNCESLRKSILKSNDLGESSNNLYDHFISIGLIQRQIKNLTTLIQIRIIQKSIEVIF